MSPLRPQFGCVGVSGERFGAAIAHALKRVLSSDGKNQRSPGDGSDERLRGAGAHSHLSPKPPIYGSVSLWVYVCSRRAKSRSVSVLLSAHWGLLPSKFNYSSSNVHRLGPAYLLGAVVVGRTSCHGFARVGGVISTAYLSNF